MTTVDVVLTYSGTTTNPQLSMDNVPGYTFDNGGPDPCGDGWFPIDGQLLGNSYRASRFAEHGSRPEHGMCDWLTRSFQRVAWSVMAACIGEGLIPGVRMTKARLTRHVAVLNLEHMCCAAMPGCETTCQASTGEAAVSQLRLHGGAAHDVRVQGHLGRVFLLQRRRPLGVCSCPAPPK